ncbi:TPA: hypothetical protein QCJ58_003993 [Enterobacter asburiae]|nr:hypothetical protein [Enterobacter asburiae]QLO47699.1 hypothetical protein HV216_11855 [Enterobacter cloacae]HDR2750804.1 hypothetical protein [Enterobacter asburiae]HDR2775120.1 hypothetical protein [Enterobacter asburiae]
MFHLDNNSGVSAMPPVGAVQSSAPRWYTEGGGGTPASYPGADWYNIIQAELLNLLSAYGINPNKSDFNQLQHAIEEAISQNATANSALLTAIAALVTSANKMPYFTGKDKVAMTDLTAFARTLLGRSDAAGVLSDLGLGSAAKKNVGTGSGQLPDMSSFTCSNASTGWQKLPSGLVIQWGQVASDPNNLVAVPFPIPFPNNVFQIIGSCLDVNNANVVAINSTDKINLNLVAYVVSQNVVTVTRTQTPVKWIAIGN